MIGAGRAHPAPVGAVVFAGALGLALLVAVASAVVPVQIVLPGLALLVGLAIFGPELLIVVALLGATGFLPFIDPNTTVLPNVKVYFFFFSVATLTMVFTWSARLLAGRPAFRLKWSLLMMVVVADLAYVALAMAATDPLAQPTLAAPFVEFPLMALATYLWLSHDDAIEGLKRVLPLVVLVVAAWTAAYVVGVGGCGPCREIVGADPYARRGLFGPESRLYTTGQYSLLALVLVAFGQALRRPRPLVVALVALGLVCVVFQAFRVQYIGMAAGMLVLIAWRLRESQNAERRLLLGAAAVAGFAALLISPVGERALTAYTELRAGTGTPGYRLLLYEQASEHWSLLGTGIGSHTLSLGVNQDIGVSSTLVVIGYLGGALQIAVLALALVRGLRAGTLAGATIAAICTLVLVTRPSLPLLELGHSPITYGAVIGFAAWLVASPRTQPALKRRRSVPQLARAAGTAGVPGI